jgi:hypothetical protein
MPTNKLVSMTFYPVVYETNTNNDFVIDSNGDKVVSKNRQQVSASEDYAFVTIKQLENHGEFRYEGILIG